MYKIIRKEILSDTIKLMVVEAPHVVRKAEPGQFVIVRINETGERIPLTIADYDREQGTITIVFQEVGKSTKHLGTLQPGDEISTVAGPLGHPTEIQKYGTIICAAGGVGIAPMYPIARALKNAGNTVISIIGVRSRDFLFWEDKMRYVSDELVVCTDDGSYGRKGVVTEPLKELLASRRIARVWAIGPGVMMKFVSLSTRDFNVPTMVSLNTIMVDGTGMCGGCRVLLNDGAKFVCTDGPEFDAHKVDWDNLLSRYQIYKKEEILSFETWKHKCSSDTDCHCEGKR
ncbi:MAG: sulfide/dihydroorotate dehydrogenase-like FAD/NAD-binding protein [Nitrospirae bacterium]|nr:sulfide/dihydroorotate dehydrogenase-like FAD/NAD-binding protein [Nitrospirota bacterium]